MPYETDYGIPNNSFSIDDTQIASESSDYGERKEVPEGTWNAQVVEVLQKEYFDNADENREQIKRLIPLEVVDEGEYQGSWIFCAVYAPPGDESNKSQMVKYQMGKQRLAKIAHACGLTSISDLNESAGKYVTVTLTRSKNGKWIDITEVVPFGAGPGQDMAKLVENTPVKDEIPF